MILHASQLEMLLRAAAAAQFGVAILNLALERILKWKPDLDRLPLLVREVFHIHSLFISITLTIFAVLTWRFAGDIASAANPLCIWLSASIGIFWAVRLTMQWTHYSASHWRGDAGRTLVHWMLTLGYGGLVAVYFAAAFWRTK
jgi:hypothetical protein